MTYEKAINAVYVSSVFLKHLIENAKSDRIEELCLSLNDTESASKEFIGGKACLGVIPSYLYTVEWELMILLTRSPHHKMISYMQVCA